MNKDDARNRQLQVLLALELETANLIKLMEQKKAVEVVAEETTKAMAAGCSPNAFTVDLFSKNLICVQIDIYIYILYLYNIYIIYDWVW